MADNFAYERVIAALVKNCGRKGIYHGMAGGLVIGFVLGFFYGSAK